jgi:hypothetical protein
MPTQIQSAVVDDSVPKVDKRIAVGENLEFQRKWWKFERAIWIFFLIILIADVLGLFGRGWLSKARQSDSAQTLVLDYERIARASTPSIMTLHFGAAAIHDGHIQVYVSQDVIKGLGAQRIAPQPATSTLGNDGVTYTFDATQLPATTEIQLQPSFPGTHHFRIQVTGGQPINATVFVVP